MTAVAPVSPRRQFLDSLGNPLAGGFVNVYLAGTTTRTDTWADRGQNTENDNPVELDNTGSCQLWLDPALTYKFVVTDAQGAAQTHLEEDNVPGSGREVTFATNTVDTFSGTGAQTAFILSVTPDDERDTTVYVGGVYVHKSAYSLAGNVLTFGVAPVLGTNNVEVNSVVLVNYDSVVENLELLTDRAEAAAESSAHIYGGVYVSAPTTRPPEATGDPIEDGDIYFGTDYMFARVNGAWVNQTLAAQAAQTAAETAEAHAETAQAAAELARDAAQALTDLYDTEAAGRAAVADGELFAVIGSGDVAAYVFRRVDVSTSTFILSMPSKAALDNITEAYTNNDAPNEDVLDGATSDLLGAFGAEGADGLLYNLLAFLADGTIDSPALDTFVDDKLGGVTFDTVTAADWGAVVVAQDGADGFSYVLFGIEVDGAFYGPGVGGGGGGGSSTATEDVYHIALLGQSNESADESKPSISTSDTLWGNYCFAMGVATWSSTDNPTTPEDRADAGFSFQALTAGSVETCATGLADAYKARLARASRFSGADQTGGPHVLVTFSGVGGRKLTELGPEDDGASGDPGVRTPGGHWPTMMDDIARAMDTAVSGGLNYVLQCWAYDQGESEGTDLKLYYAGAADLPSVVLSGYTTKGITMAETFDTEARAITGQTRPIPLFVTPPCASLLISQAWMDIHDESDLVFVVGPRYQMPSALLSTYESGGSQIWGNWIHHSPDGHRWKGELRAKVIHRVLNEGRDWEPLRVVTATKIDSTTVDVVVTVPEPPLVIETTLMAKLNGWGFSLFTGTIDSVLTRQYATAVALQADGRTVRLTFASVPSGALLDVGNASTADLGITPLAASVGVGSVSAGGFSTYTVTVTGDISATIAPLLNDDVFYLYGSRPSRGTIRSVAVVGGNTVFHGEDRELVDTGGYLPFQAGNTLTFGRIYGGVNLRDSDNALSIYSFTGGTREGEPYPLHNWCCQQNGLTIIGA